MILNDSCKLRRRKRTVVTVDAEGNDPLIYIVQQRKIQGRKSERHIYRVLFYDVQHWSI